MTTTAPDLTLWDEKRVSAETDIPVGTLRQHRARGLGLPFVRVGHHVRYRPADIDAWLTANTVVPHRD